METRTLDGVRVIDLSQLETGPVCTLTPAQMGAEVIKIERSKYGEQSRMGAHCTGRRARARIPSILPC